MKVVRGFVAACTALGAVGLVMQTANARKFVRLRPAANDEPVDVYVAMRDEAANVDGFLAAVLRMPNVARVLVADDGCGDDTVARLAADARRDPRVYWLPLSGDDGGKAAALAEVVHVLRRRRRGCCFWTPTFVSPPRRPRRSSRTHGARGYRDGTRLRRPALQPSRIWTIALLR
ncbi:MAG: glycosyltransferase family 2 protein, partial [Candidatus Velthaea sp.]